MIALREVTKDFASRLGRDGRVRALDGISLDVPPGTALGIAGPNGAGKSTLLRVLLGYLRPSSGEATVGGLLPRAYVERHGIGYVSELIAIPPGWTVRGTLQTFAALAEVADERRRIGELLDRLGIAELADRRVGTLSKGNLQRLALAQALLAPRRVMILDEPSHGLDPEWTARIRDLLTEWRAEDPERVLLIASHNLEEMGRNVERVAVLRRGRLCTVLEAPAATVLRLVVENAGEAAVRAALPAARPLAAPQGAYHLPAGDPAGVTRGIRQLIDGGAVLRELTPETPRLDDRVRAALLSAEGT